VEELSKHLMFQTSLKCKHQPRLAKSPNITPGDLPKEQSRLQRTIRDEVLESMHRQLWYAGRKGNVSPLHHQKVIRREIILTERARLHLVWFDQTIYGLGVLLNSCVW
jgi:hypothetical protein